MDELSKLELEAALWLPWMWVIKLLDAHHEFVTDLTWWRGSSEECSQSAP